ncbi:flocculation protein FLO11 [Diachasma alloeum]|uniref:flocculation protein FLO11 n=1 Tax=Diachasma alloeum TaxID=454923 RepID=UPI0007383439|nr:flocculation protein FLO11 [Diachasma alloeum]
MTQKYIILFVILACVSVNLGQVYKATGGIDNNNAVEVVESAEPEANKSDFITQTVYGFLDFTTTIGNTVMVFSPQSAPAEGEKPRSSPVIETKPAAPKKSIDIQPSKTHKSDNQGETKKPLKNTKVIVSSVVNKDQKNTESPTPSTENSKGPVLSTVVQVVSDGDKPVKNNLAEPEYDYLSKQPTEVVDETYKLINLRPSSKAPPKPRPSPKKEKENPTGLVTRLGGTIVKDGLTTVHETSVLGTYINGKYAQVLQSTSRILKGGGTPVIPEGKIRPTNSQRILKTIGPQHGKLKPQLEPTPAHQQEESSLPLEGPGPKTTRRHSAPHARPKFRNKIYDDLENYEAPQQPRNQGKNRATTPRPNYKNRALTTTTTEAPVSRRRSGFRPSNSQQFVSPPKPLRPKADQNSNQSPVPKIKLPRTQGRWSYKTTPKPRIAIRKQSDDEERVSTLEPVSSEPTVTTVTEEKTSLSSPPAQKKIQEGGTYDDELDPSETEEVSSTSVQSDQALPEPNLPVETLNVEISTPADFNDVYFEIATIKSPYAFQVGTMKNTRYITVTSTMKKTFATAEPSTTSTPTEPLTENILANTGAAYESSLPLDSSVATLPAITLESGQATPPLETLTETFTTTQTLLKTHLLPVVAAGNTSTITLVQTYNIARMVTATKTLPPSEIYQFIPSKTLNEFNTKLDEAGSELHLELDFGDDDRDDEDIPKRVVVPNSEADDLDVFRSSGKPKDAPTTSAPEPQLTPEQAQQLALLKYFGQQQPAAPQVITTSRPVIVLETVYESHVIPLVNNGNTVYSTLSRPVATVPRTSYEFGMSTLAPIITPQVPQIPQVPLFQQQPQFTVTSAPFVTQTLATVSDSRVLKLTFGAKTAYTTLFSTKVVPTEITTYVTTTLPVQPTVPAFPGYYPPPVGYPQFPFVG